MGGRETLEASSASSAKMKPSPDGEYVVMDYITIGVEDDGEGHPQPEVYHCVVVSLALAAVKDQFQEDCDGEWTVDNQWVNSKGEVVFGWK